MASHVIHFPDLPPPEARTLVITGPEAHHAARVKRLERGDAVAIGDGRGGVVDARIADIRKQKVTGEWEIEVEMVARRSVPRESPALRVCAGVPKGDRLEQMIEGLSQVGVAAWAPLSSERSIVEPRENKRTRLERVAIESMKQCGRAWVMEIGESLVMSGAIGGAGRVVIADASGPAYTASGAGAITLLIGPEGGWTPRELAAARDGGAVAAKFGPHTLRTETAAVVAAAVILDHERRSRT